MNTAQQPSTHEHPDPSYTDTASPIAISHIVHTLRSYARAIALIVAAVALLYAAAALAYYLSGPNERITTLPFRLDFQGAASGTYPNGQKFSPAEIVSSPVLQRVYESNNLSRFATYPEFSRSLFVLESNTALERLSTEYQVLLADPKLTSVDRDRIQKEFDLKKASVNKNEFSVNYSRETGGGELPEQLARKVLSDVLATWARFATREQHVLMYEVSVLSPSVIDPTALENSDSVVAVHVLRSKIVRVQDNIMQLAVLPAAKLARTKSDGLTLEEISVRLDEIMRFRLEPLVPLAVSNHLLANPASTIAFVETQLAHDRRDLMSREAMVQTVKDGLLMYFTNQAGTAQNIAESASREAASNPANGAAVTPQLSESFLDRLLTITSNAADIDYRQDMIDQYRTVSKEVIPAQEAVAYDEELLATLKGAGGGQAGRDAAVHAQIAAIRDDVRTLIGKINEIHGVISANLNPATDLFTMTSPPYTRVHRTRSLKRLMLIGAFAILATLIAAALGALLHQRVRDEEKEEGYVAETDRA